jgi:hypothetical protein
MISKKINDEGEIPHGSMEIGSLKMTCECGDCQSHTGMDYKRLPSEIESGWEEEPIFLCVDHAKNHIPIWRPVDMKKWSFVLGDEPEAIHVIKTGFTNKYMVVHEDAYEISLGRVDFHTKEEVESIYGVEIN